MDSEEMKVFSKKHKVTREAATKSVILMRRKDRVYQTYHVKNVQLDRKQSKKQDLLFKLLKGIKLYTPPFQVQIIWGKQKSKKNKLLYGKKAHTLAMWKASESTIFVHEEFFKQSMEWQKRTLYHEIGHALFDYSIILKNPYYKRYWSKKNYHYATEIFANLYSMMPKRMFFRIKNKGWLKALFDVCSQNYAKLIHAAVFAYASSELKALRVDKEVAKMVSMVLVVMKNEQQFRNGMNNFFSKRKEKEKK